MIFGSHWAETKNADEASEQCRYEEAFRLYAKIASDESKDPLLRAYAYACMGWLVVPSPGLGEGEDESGYTYFVRAIEIAPDCGDAWSGLITTYGDRFPKHQDQGRFLEGLGRLLQIRNDLPDTHERMLVQGMAELGIPIKVRDGGKDSQKG